MLFRSGANKGDPRAQYTIGFFYLKGINIQSNSTEANKWFRRAALQGEARSQNAIGYSLATGYGTETNLTEGYMWLLLAASKKESRAIVNIETLEPTLSSEQLAEGKRRAAEFRPKFEFKSTLSVWSLEKALSTKAPIDSRPQ